MYYEGGQTKLEGDDAFEARVKEFEFFATIDFTKLRGCIFEQRVDSEGEVSMCVTIPMLKNGIKFEGRHKYRVVLGALRCNDIQATTHLLLPVISKRQYRQMINMGYQYRYPYLLPLYGQVVGDITKIAQSPFAVYNPNSRLNPSYNTSKRYVEQKKLMVADAAPNKYDNIQSANLVRQQPSKYVGYQHQNNDLRENILNMTNNGDK